MPPVLFVRHGQSTWNAEGRWQGLADSPLSVLGEEQARDGARRMKGMGLVAAVSSPLARARRTAAIIAEELELGEVAIIDALVERDVGEWSGLTTAEIEERWPGLLDEWRAGTLASLPGGEGDIAGRVAPAAEEIVRQAASGPGPVVVVTHGGVLRSLERHCGVAPSRPVNLCGRWLAWDHDALTVGEAFSLGEPEEPGTTTVL